MSEAKEQAFWQKLSEWARANMLWIIMAFGIIGVLVVIWYLAKESKKTKANQP